MKEKMKKKMKKGMFLKVKNQDYIKKYKIHFCT